MSGSWENAAEIFVVGLAQGGDRDAFTELVRRRQSWIRNLMRRLCREPALADDLAQQVFLQAWRNISKLREAQKFPGWLKQIAINVWLKHQRSNDPLADADLEERIPAAASSSARPDIAMDLDAALSTLADQPRACVVLAYHEGMSHAEIAAALNIPLGTVKSHVVRSTERLRTLLSAYSDGEVK